MSPPITHQTHENCCAESDAHSASFNQRVELGKLFGQIVRELPVVDAEYILGALRERRDEERDGGVDTPPLPAWGDFLRDALIEASHR